MVLGDLDLLTGTEPCLVAMVPGAGDRWHQVHFNVDVARLFFGLKPDDERSITLEKVGADGKLLARTSRELVYPESNRNSRIEFDFGWPKPDYPADDRPIVVVVQADHKTYRYRTLMPGDSGHQEMMGLVSTGQSVGRTMKGVRRRIVTLDDVEAAWSGARLRGSAG